MEAPAQRLLPPAKALNAAAARRQAQDVAVADDEPRFSPAEEVDGWWLPDRSGATVWFDHTDLAHYFTANRTPTGIQRVEIELYRAVRRRVRARDEPNAAAVAFDAERRCWVRLPRRAFDLLCGVAGEDEDGQDAGGAEAAMDDRAWGEAVKALQAAIGGAAPAPFERNDVLITVGASWWIPDYLMFVRHLQHERGVLYAPFVHDCIPMIVPETCAGGLVGEFREWFAAAMRAADMTFANSRCTARDIVTCARVEGLPTPAPHVVPLDAHAGARPSGGDAADGGRGRAAMTHARLGVRGRFVLFVATIEARKDHIFVFRCWQRLIEMFGPAAVPDLLCVGKSGWLVEFTLNFLSVTPALAGKVRLLGTVSDEDLAGLYASAEFCVYNSFYEGWGLPVSESLCHGRVPLAPNHSSLPEAGGEFAVYFEPGSAESFVAQTIRLLDRDSRAALEQQIRARFRPRSWSAVLEQILSAATTAPARRRPDRAGIPLELGEIYWMGRRAAATQTQRSRRGRPLLAGSLARFGTGWWQPEEWGCWSRQGEAHLLFSVADPSGRETPRRYMAYLLLRGGPAQQRVSVASSAGRFGPVTLQPHRRELLRIWLDASCGPDADSLISISAEPYTLADFTEGRDQRRIGFGIEALAVIASDDLEARLNIMEMAIMPL